MKFYNIFIITFLSLTVFSCGGEKKSTTPKFSLKIDGKTEKFKLNSAIKATLINSENKTISNVDYKINDEKLSNSSKNPLILETTIPETTLLGKQNLKATITYDDGKTTTTRKNLTILSNMKPKVYTYKIINTFPHDQKAYTQGLEFFRDTLFESTGQRGQSSLRKVDYKTGKIYQKIELDNRYFGEGITVLNDKLYMLTWRSNTGFIYNPNNLERIDTFTYQNSKEGWGLCNDGEKLYKSDGTENIWILDPKTLKEQYAIQVCDNKRTYVKANELEYINGKIFANSYQNPSMMIINPKNGALEGIIDFRGLKEKVTNHSQIDVFNGIAFNTKTNTYFVTGKYWDKLFEVEIVEK
ncbi:glutaminyl-peptide cyclotransferase [Kordia algicida OT-1]|uniref:Glutamine cyclotransferase n=1 Tax=Kordia algicida OT-1 TaxID=391587 RepID=A9E4P6_9FLAO|nr:glutaminyl-peptide cyclotransferase [Kordia algicida]EDP95112.1 Glutamine cyclotransferase [Kordia algicida OT-1]